MDVVFGINYIENPPDGLPTYLYEFDKQFNDVVFFNIITTEPKNGKTVEEKATSGGNKIFYIYEPFLFYSDYPEMLKYENLLSTCAPYVKQAKRIFLNDWFSVPVLEYISTKARVFFLVHLFYSGFSPNTKYFQVWEKLGFEKAETIIANSNFIEQEIISLYPEYADKVIAIPLGVDKSFWTPSINLESKKILYFGRLDEQKNMTEFLQAIVKYSKTLKEAGLELLIAGRGAYRANVCELHYDGDVVYLGELDKQKLKEVLSGVKYCVYPSMYEPYGLALNEGLASGKVCIAEDVGGHCEQVQDSKNGFLVDNPEAMFELILALEDYDKKRLQKICENAVKSARDIKQHFKELLEVVK